MAENVIEVNSLIKEYGNFTAVDKISFNIKKGEIFAFLGPNGRVKPQRLRFLNVFEMQRLAL